jgi:hypothetical protein
MGDRLVKAPNQGVARFLELFPHVKKAVRARTGPGQNSNKPEPILVGLRLQNEAIELVSDDEPTPDIATGNVPEIAQLSITGSSNISTISASNTPVISTSTAPELTITMESVISPSIPMADEGGDEW